MAMKSALRWPDAQPYHTPHLTNHKGEVLYATYLTIAKGKGGGSHPSHITTQVKYVWMNINNVGDAFFEGVWGQILSEHQTDELYLYHEIYYHPVNPDPSESLLLLEEGEAE